MLWQPSILTENSDFTKIALHGCSGLADRFYQTRDKTVAMSLGGRSLLCKTNRHKSLSSNGKTPIGTYGYVPKVDYFFGFPRAIQPGGIEMDLDAVTTFTESLDGDHAKVVNFVQQTGTFSSALEHAVLEQMFATDPLNPPNAVSAVKALSIANAAGQRIYQITQANQAPILPNIRHDKSTMDEIRASLMVGKTIITHTDAISAFGSGYSVFGNDVAGQMCKVE